MTDRLTVILLAAAGLPLASCAGVGAGTPARESAPGPSDPMWEIRREGQPCGGYPAPGEALTKCAEGLVCDYEGAGVDMPGRCKRR